MCIKLLGIIKRKKYFFIWLLSTLLMMIFYPYIQSLGRIESWLKAITMLNMFLYIVFSALFGITVMLQVYNIREVKKCHIHAMGGNILGVIAGFFVTQCPVCTSFLSFFLPAAAIVIIATYNTYVNIFAISLLILTTHMLGGFDRHYEN